MTNFREGVACDVVVRDGKWVVRLLQPYLNDDRHQLITGETIADGDELCKILNVWASRWSSAGYFRCIASETMDMLRFVGGCFVVTFFAVVGVSVAAFILKLIG